MSISFNSNFPGQSGREVDALLRAHFGLKLSVRVDGQEVSRVVQFNLAEQSVVRLVCNENGEPVLDGDIPATEKLHGKVTVELVDAGEELP